MEQLSGIITLNPEVCQGKPTIRNMRFTVSQLLELLASGMTETEILADFSYLTHEDILACLKYAADLSNLRTVSLD